MTLVGQAGNLFMLAPQEESGVIYLGGAFSAVRGVGRTMAACVAKDVNNPMPELLAWNPSGAGGTWVLTMALSGNDLYIGGTFTTMSGVTRNRAACVDSDPSQANPTLRPWNPDCSSGVRVIHLNGPDMYMGGDFTSIRGDARRRAACVASDSAMAAPTLRAWHPNCNAGVFVFVLSFGAVTMYMGGDFTMVGGVTRNKAAAVNGNPSLANPSLRAWNPNCEGGHVRAMLLTGADMYIGGNFTTVRGVSRNRAACVDSDTSQANPTLRAWNPNCDAQVNDMAHSGSNMYLVGFFTAVRGTARNHAACVDSNPAAANPALRAWNPDCSSWIQRVILDSSDIYIIGAFSTVQTISRPRAACIASDVNMAVPTLRAWNPQCNNNALAIILA